MGLVRCLDTLTPSYFKSSDDGWLEKRIERIAHRHVSFRKRKEKKWLAVVNKVGEWLGKRRVLQRRESEWGDKSWDSPSLRRRWCHILHHCGDRFRWLFFSCFVSFIFVPISFWRLHRFRSLCLLSFFNFSWYCIVCSRPSVNSCIVPETTKDTHRKEIQRTWSDILFSFKFLSVFSLFK